MSLTRPFDPALVPTASRAVVEAPITLVRRFVSIFLILSLIVLAGLAFALATLPFSIHTLNLLIKGVLTVFSITFFTAALFATNVRRLDLAHQLAQLRALCYGDTAAAKPLALDLVSDFGPADTVASALALMDGVTRVDTVTNPSYTSSELDIESKAHESSSLLPKPPGPFADPPIDLAAAAAEGSLEAVRLKMENDSMYIFERVIAMTMKSVFTVVVSIPVLCFVAGYILCELGAPFSGAELVMAGFFTGSAGAMAWATVSSHATELLDTARVEVQRQNFADMEEQKAKEIEVEENRIREAEIEKENAVRSRAVKEEELRNVRAASEESRRIVNEQVNEQPMFFGIPLPYEVNPFHQEEDEGSEGGEASNNENV